MSARIEKLMTALDEQGYDAEQLVMNYLVDAIAPEAGIEWDDERDEWVTGASEAYAVGSPDTTSARANGAPGDCKATTLHPSGATLFCTRDNGHDGPHAAGDGEVIVAVWDD